MAYFKRIALITPQHKLELLNYRYIQDLTELCHLGAFIEQSVEHVSIPVSPNSTNPFKEFKKSIQRNKFDMVGISAMTPGYNSAREYARIAKEAGIYVVMGGYHPTALPDEVLEDPNVDAVIRGEGELPLRDLILHGPDKSVLGLSFKEGDSIQHNSPAALIHDLDSLPLPSRRLRPVRFGEKGDAYSVDTVYSSRGCIAKCTFCANDTMNQNLRNRSPEHFVEELEQIHDKHHKKFIKISDSIFLFDPGRVEKILELMFKRNLTNFRIMTESRPDDIVRCQHLMKDLAHIGFERISLGIESPDSETFKKLRKGGSVNKNEKAIRILQENKLGIDAFLIIGHAHETEKNIRKYSDFAKNFGLYRQAIYFIMTPYPGTQIFKEYKNKNLIKSFDWDNYNNFGSVVGLENIGQEKLRSLLASCYGTTDGIFIMFKGSSGTLGILGQLLFRSIFWLYFLRLQNQTQKARNDFMRSYYLPSYDSFHKNWSPNWLDKVSQRIFKAFKLRVEIDGKNDSFVMVFQKTRDTFTLDVRPYEDKDGNILTITLDDLEAIQQKIDIIQASRLVYFLSFKNRTGSFYWVRNYFACGPLMVVITLNLLKLSWKVGWRYLKALNPFSSRFSPQPSHQKL